VRIGPAAERRSVIRLCKSEGVAYRSRCGEALLVGEGGASLLTRQEVVMAPF
jgi:hypothetical protein